MNASPITEQNSQLRAEVEELKRRLGYYRYPKPFIVANLVKKEGITTSPVYFSLEEWELVRELISARRKVVLAQEEP